MNQKNITRENFLKISGLSLVGTLMGGGAVLRPERTSAAAGEDLTVQQVIDLIIGSIDGEPLQNTVDTVKAGDPAVKCSGVVSTFLDTAEIIQKTADLGANLILTHEPTFYNHQDDVDWLENDLVYEFKRKLLEENGIVVWRFHDYWHRHQPDGILQGFVEEVGWEKYLKVTRRNTGICTVPKTTLGSLARSFKEKLNLKRPFIVGNPELECTQIGLLPGSWGARSQMRMLNDDDIEVLVVGEVAEWETSEYIRDAAYAGMKKGLIILGHAPSEGPGMKHVLNWLQPKIPDIPVYYEETPDAFLPV